MMCHVFLPVLDVFSLGW